MSTHSDLRKRYNDLNSFERIILQFLSVVYEPAHTTLIVNCLRKLGVKSPRGNKPSAPNLNHHIKKFQDIGLVNENQQCVPELVETLTKISIEENNFFTFVEVIRKEAPVSYYYGKWTTRCWRGAREMRIGIYTQNFELIDESAEFLSGQCTEIISTIPLTVQITCTPFDPNWFKQLPPSFQLYLLDEIIRYSQASLTDFSDITEYIGNKESFAHLNREEQIPFIRLLFNQLLFKGELTQANNLLSDFQSFFVGTGAGAAMHFLLGNRQEARKQFDKDIEILRDITGQKNVFFSGPIGLFALLTILQSDVENGYQYIIDTISLSPAIPPMLKGAYESLGILAATQLNKGMSANGINLEPNDSPNSWTVLFTALCQYWLNSSLQPDVESHLISLYTKATESDNYLFTISAAEILAEISHDNSDYIQVIEEIRKKQSICSILSVLQPDEPWKRGLQALIQAASPEHAPGSGPALRLVWVITYENGTISISPREQKLGDDDRWSKGRPLSLARLHNPGKLSYLTFQDRKICSTIYSTKNPDTLNVSFGFEMEKTLKEMVGHPLLFLSGSPMVPIEFVKGEPELLVEERGEHLHIRFAQPLSDTSISVFHETPTRFKIISINDNHRRIAQITGKDGLTVPIEASEQVLTAIGNISSFMTVHSAIAADIHTDQGPKINFVEADSTIYMHLLPYGTGFKLEMFVKPFENGGHYLKPGQGVENLMAEVQGKRQQTKRNLPLEETKAREIEELCPILDLAIDLEQENEREWHLQDPEDCLQALLELQAIRDKVVVEWPEGEKLTIGNQVSMKNLNLKIRTNRQSWFGMSGSLQFDQDRVIDLKELLSKLDITRGRFIEIEDGHYIALTQELKKRLEDMNSYGTGFDNTNDNELLIHPLAAMPLEKLASQANTEADDGWKNQITKINDSQNYKPDLPSTLQAELREYQVEGFHWLAKLAHWGVGGCLADDMGLGKTLQSLAVILLHATQGPSLVVAPTSVTANWHSEANRFAPTLQIKTLSTKDRKKTVEELGSFDLLTTTYTLLQQESELLASVNWQTIILDEAQAIKNAATKRSKAAMSLRGKFKLITTGTPIENHLGELWNLFNFINPGLLSTLNHFNRYFAIPIERYQDREAKLKLKKLIRPFILRRIKSDVLDELPSRTEVTLQVEMSEEERYFYEALRQNALDILESNREKKGRHLQILTEIMKLRQACCNPKLITEDTAIKSSKLDVFASVVDELIGGRHKALVFSQFIGHLKILREHLDEKGVHYQYLDGTTSNKNRKDRVDRFQAGEGDLFLISLKAGGLGLNLTAADYVLHMDPWWNPAIEDQASDRAHRIGQTRPVTIYRLVCKNTIEEKIVKLHQEKRDLAGSLLEGSDMSAKMSADDLLDLIREG